jgi:hypothetical protein
MRALEFTRLTEDPITPVDMQRVQSGKPVDPELAQALADLQPAAEQDNDLFTRVKSVVSSYLKKLQQLANTEIESVEVLEDAQTALQYDKFEAIVNQRILELGLDMQDANVRTIRDKMLRDIRDLSATRVEKGRQEGREEAVQHSQEIIQDLNNEIKTLAKKVANYIDPDPNEKYNSKEKKKQANALKALEGLKSGLFTLFFNKVYLENELTEQQVMDFVKDCVAGNVLNMPSMIKAKQGTIDNFVIKHKDVYDVVVNDLINFKGEAGTGGALGPAEILLSAIGSPVSTGTGGVKGDLAVKMDGKTLGVEVKAGSKIKGSGARLNGTAIQDGKGALANFKNLYKKLGISDEDLPTTKNTPTYTISENTLPILNKKLKTFDNQKLNEYVIGVLKSLVTNYDEVYETKPEEIKEKVDATIQPGAEDGPIIFKEFRNLITYVQLVSYNLTDEVSTIMTIDTGKRSFTVTSSPEEFISQIGKGHVQAASLSITADPQTASFHWRSA